MGCKYGVKDVNNWFYLPSLWNLPADIGRLHLSETRRRIVPAEGGLCNDEEMGGSWGVGVKGDASGIMGDATMETGIPCNEGAVVYGIDNAGCFGKIGVWKKKKYIFYTYCMMNSITFLCRFFLLVSFLSSLN